MVSRNIGKLFSWLAFTLALAPVSLAASPDLKGCYQESFKVTGYYSPQKGQSFYVKGSYSDDVVLNGAGLHGSSGKAVFNGMLAAPKLYSFATKIYLPGLGVGSVEDRGGAIVEKGERGEKYHRIDVWMGQGELGLKRALSFGVKYIDGWVCPANSDIAIGIDMNNIPIMNNFFQETLWKVQLRNGRHDPWVGVLQGYLKKIGFFSSAVNNTFGESTKNALCSFQNTILGVSKQDFRCGYFGVSTRVGLKSYLEKKGLLGIKIDTKVTNVTKGEKDTKGSQDNGPIARNDEVIYIPKLKGEKETKEAKGEKGDNIITKLDPRVALNQIYLSAGDTRNYQFLTEIPFGTQSMEVKFLQRKLQWMGQYQRQITGIYDEYTKGAIFQFQVDKKILKYDDTSVSKGWLGPKTRELLNKVK